MRHLQQDQTRRVCVAICFNQLRFDQKYKEKETQSVVIIMGCPPAARLIGVQLLNGGFKNEKEDVERVSAFRTQTGR